MAHAADLRAEILAKYPEVMRNMSAEDSAAALNLLEASAAHWGEEMWRYFWALLEREVEGTPMLPEISKLYSTLQMYLAGVGGRTMLSMTVLGQLRAFHTYKRHELQHLADFVKQIACAYLKRRFSDVQVDAPGAGYDMEVCDGYERRILTLRWQPLTGMSYSRACLLLAGMFCVRRLCTRLRMRFGSVGAVDWELIAPQPDLPLRFSTIPPNPDPMQDMTVDRSADLWMLEFPVPENIPRARARMRFIHRLLPVQTLECRLVLAAACRRVVWESTEVDYMQTSPRPTWEPQWPDELALPYADPWSSADAEEGEPGPWSWAFHQTIYTSYVPINTEDEKHRWASVPHARILLAERELLRRYIKVAKMAVRMGAYAQSQHLRLGDGQPASTIPPELLQHIFGSLRPRFRSFQNDLLGQLTRGDDRAWRY